MVNISGNNGTSHNKCLSHHRNDWLSSFFTLFSNLVGLEQSSFDPVMSWTLLIKSYSSTNSFNTPGFLSSSLETLVAGRFPVVTNFRSEFLQQIITEFAQAGFLLFILKAAYFEEVPFVLFCILFLFLVSVPLFGTSDYIWPLWIFDVTCTHS